MITPTQDTALQRWDILPDNLREALCLESNSDFIWKASADEHIPENKIREVSRVSGYVLLGFLHPEDVAQELKERLSIDAKTANLIEDALNKRIFAPLRTDIDKVYSPVSKVDTASIAMAPKIIQGMTAAPLRAAVQKPTTLSDVGWSRASSAGPGIKLTTLSGVSQPPRPAITPTPPSAPTPPVGTATSDEPAPIMLHEDTSFKAVEKNSGFTLSRPGAGADVHMGQVSVVPTPPRPAVLEFGGAKPPVAPASKPAATPQSNAVHYTELKLSLSAVPAADSGPRNVSQIAPPTPPKPPAFSPAPAPATAPIPKPPSPPQMQTQPPQPPKPPQNNKPIVKDFL